MTLRRRDLIATVFALTVAALFIRLGFWQLHRLEERRAENALIRAAWAAPPVDLPMPHLEADALRDRRVHARGVYDYAHERIWTHRTYEGAPGVGLITPLRLADGREVLVDRGFVLSPDAEHVDARRYREGDSVEVTGLIFPIPASEHGDSLLLPFLIEVDQASAPDHPTGLVRWPTPVLSDGPHLSYAIQWFAFGAIAIVGTLVLLRKRLREPAAPGPPVA